MGTNSRLKRFNQQGFVSFRSGSCRGSSAAEGTILERVLCFAEAAIIAT